MKSRRKKWLAGLLAICMGASMLPFTAFGTNQNERVYTLTNTAGILITQINDDGAFNVTAVNAQPDEHAAGDVLVIQTTGTVTKKGITVKLDAGVTRAQQIPIVLDGVKINGQGTQNLCAFDVQDGASVALTLRGQSDIASGSIYGGINLGDNSSIVIEAESGAVLTATGGSNTETDSGDVTVGTGNGGPGIGCSSAIQKTDANYNITIDGAQITAIGRGGSAGIGGGVYREGGIIQINDATIVASGTGTSSPGAWGGPSGGAGIGGGTDGVADTINISNSNITANGGGNTNIGWSDISIQGGKLLLTGRTNSGSGLYGNITIDETAKIKAVSSGDNPAIYYKKHHRLIIR